MSKKGPKVLLFTFLFLIFSSLLNISVLAGENIEIFDITKEEVVKVVPSNAKVQKEIIRYLYNITGMYPKFNPVPDKGFAVKVFLEPPIAINNELLSSTVDEVIVMFPPEESPFLMVFQDEDNLVCYNFKGRTNKLLKELNYKVKLK